MCFREPICRGGFFFFSQVGYDALRTVTESSRLLGWHAMLPASHVICRPCGGTLSALGGHAVTLETSAAVLTCCIRINSPIWNRDEWVCSDQVMGLVMGFDPRIGYDFCSYQRPVRLWCLPEVIWDIFLVGKAVGAWSWPLIPCCRS